MLEKKSLVIGQESLVMGHGSLVMLANSEDHVGYGAACLAPVFNAAFDFGTDAPEWISLPFGDVPYDRDGIRGLQRMNAAAAARFVASMEAAMAADPRLSAGVPMYVGHPDYWPANGKTDPAEFLRNMPPAFGWIKAFRVSANSLDMRVEWTPEGAALVASRKYKFFSPLFLGERVRDESGTKVFEARFMRSCGLVNTPNWPMPPMVNAADIPGGTEKPMTLMERIAALLGGTYADEEALVNAAQSTLGQVPTLEQALAAAQTETQTLTEQVNAANATRDGAMAKANELAAAFEAERKARAELLVNAAVARGAVLQEHAPARIAELANAGDAFAARAAELAALPKLMKTEATVGDAAGRTASVHERRARVQELVNAAMQEHQLSYDDAFKRIRRENRALFGE